MYSRDFGGIRSDGQLREFEDNWKKEYMQKQQKDVGFDQKQTHAFPPSEPKPYYYAPPPSPPPQEEETVSNKTDEPPSKKAFSLFNFDFLKNIQIDDLILIGIGILLLLDSDASNDMLIVLIALMLFF